MSAFDIRMVPTADLTPGDRDLMFALFAANYRDANLPYLEKSFGVLKYAAIATEKGTPAGFALAEMRVLDLPRLPQTIVGMAGICCVDAAFRRRGLFGGLEGTAMGGAGIRPEGRYLSTGRMAHPATMRTMARNASVVPMVGVPITEWQRAVGRAIADAYGVVEFDDETFVVRGSGVPIGYPVMEIDVEPEEWLAFERVDRDRGDSLLGVCWHPEAPEGWDDP